MAKKVIEVPEELEEVWESMVENLTPLQRMLGRLGGGKAVDYAEVERVVSPGGRQDRPCCPPCDPAVARHRRSGRGDRGRPLQPGGAVRGAVPHAGGVGFDRALVVSTSRHARGASGLAQTFHDPPLGRRIAIVEGRTRFHSTSLAFRLEFSLALFEPASDRMYPCWRREHRG